VPEPEGTAPARTDKGESPPPFGGNSVDRIEELVQRVGVSGYRYLEFLRVASMSAGVYVLRAGAVDQQQPHTEDELYYVVRGRGRFRLREMDRTVGPGDLLFVAAREPHLFRAIEEELVLLVIFAPAERTASGLAPRGP
jgi:quercetin dioxygenase-like cupin family protein